MNSLLFWTVNSGLRLSNIGLRGSMAIKEPNKWRTNPNAFPRKTLHLDLLAGELERTKRAKHTVSAFWSRKKPLQMRAALWYQAADILSVTNIARLSQWLFASFNPEALVATESFSTELAIRCIGFTRLSRPSPI